MSLRPSGRIVLPTTPALAVCAVLVRENATQIVGVNVSACCAKDIEPCIVQGAAKTLQFRDAETVDYSDCTEITFDVWAQNISGTSLLSKTLSGATITVADGNIFQCTITNAQSAALPAGRHYCEAWVTLTTGERRCVGLGRFIVEDSRKHDA